MMYDMKVWGSVGFWQKYVEIVTQAVILKSIWHGNIRWKRCTVVTYAYESRIVFETLHTARKICYLLSSNRHSNESTFYLYFKTSKAILTME